VHRVRIHRKVERAGVHARGRRRRRSINRIVYRCIGHECLKRYSCIGYADRQRRSHDGRLLGSDPSRPEIERDSVFPGCERGSGRLQTEQVRTKTVRKIFPCIRERGVQQSSASARTFGYAM
jgi:hypothetical protein